MVNYTAAKLKLAYAIQRTIESLENKIQKHTDKLVKILGAGEIPVSNTNGTGRRKMSAAGRAKIAAAQRARWAKINGTAVGTPAKTGRRKMSKSARAKIAAAAKIRWAKAKAAGRTRL